LEEAESGALERPDLARTVTIVDSNTAAPENPELPSDRFYEALEQRVPGPPSPDTVRIEPDLQSYSQAHITNDFVNRRREISSLPKLRDAYLEGDAGRRAMWEAGLNRKRQETLDRIARSGIAVPVLVVWGRDDPSAPLPLGIELFDRVCAHSERAELHVINRAGHYVFREHPMVFNAALRSFCLQS
jgi:2-hydroxy-6-oxonona-2,4-dienedioate hydrolase